MLGLPLNLGLNLGGHLGDRTAALVDGQLTELQAERAWQHVLGCPGCRQAVEQQVAAKQALGALRPAEPEPQVPRSWLDPEALAAWQQVVEVDRQSRRRTTLVTGVLGGSALTASLAVAVVVGAGGVAAPTARPVPGGVTAGILAPVVARSTTGSTTDTRATSWTGSETGAETSRPAKGFAVRGDRSR